ncbi:ABC-2 type transporter-domain-containing protein [Crepidotus variabilis]|uniref:ABC-2 type transporter-domain-containing protein n=1 Tax=Crepidotus variabilis TaxID=179855 RepID=A0A9P6EM93_9AGAR|nr:ABC-2 type transporter-domain-containing protein [Crepidotus variabilis]
MVKPKPRPISGLSDLQRRPHRSNSETTLQDSFDLEKDLANCVKQMEEEGVKKRTLGVVFENLNVTGLGASASIQPTIGSVFNPANLMRSIQKLRHPPLKQILSDFEGVVRPGEMLLVLGRPGSGCSTFLKVLANDRSEFHAVEGTVHYDSLTPAQLEKHYRGDVQYSPEDDVHFPTLTVDQTIRFAAAARAPQNRVNGESRTTYVDRMTGAMRSAFGLNHAKDTMIGNEWIRGVSGGEKKRVSISETMVGRSLLTSWDNSTRGLDSSTALEFGRALRLTTDKLQRSTVVSIYQASENLYDLFDKVCVIYEGRMVYFGPASEARQYFIDMGYEPVPRQTTPDFLVAVTNPNGRVEVSERNEQEMNQEKRRRPIPRTAAEFADYYKKSETRKRNALDMEDYKKTEVGKVEKLEYYRESVKAEHSRHTRSESPYIISLPMQVRLAMRRRLQVMKGDLTTQILNTFVYAFQATILGTMFLKLPVTTTGFFPRGGVMFFSTFAPALFTSAEIPALFFQRPIVHRHQKAALYHPMIEALALTIVDIPFTLATLTVFTIIIYFVVQLQQTAAQFFIFFLFVITDTIAMKAFFRTLAAAFSDPAPAQAIGGVCILVLALYTGYQIPRPSMIGALRWLSYINPITYSFEAIITNEFHTIDAACSSLVPSGPGYENISLANQVCTTVGSQPGVGTVSGDTFVGLSFAYYYKNLWRNFGILIAFAVFFIFCLLLFSEFNTSSSQVRSVVLFKNGSKASLDDDDDKIGDEEKGASRTRSPTIQEELVYVNKEKEKEEQDEEVLQAAPKMTDIFSWQHIDYTVPVHSEHRQLLDDVSGFVAPGKLTALMGESGAGKTTLLNVLAERTTTGVITGDRFLNGQPLPMDFQAQTGYVQQMDTHVPLSTVREALRFSARLRQPASVSTAEKDAYAEKCLKWCGLEAYADAMVGSLGVEHRKRTTIGVELAAKPRLLLFLDEPTSGLDSQSAWAIMSFLRELADNGQAILCTIHQPSAELFSAFDRLLLLARGGKTVFFGDIGENGHNMIDYFQRGGARTCGPQENPAEYMLDVIGAGATATSARNWHDVWLRSKECTNLQSNLATIHEDGRKGSPVDASLNSTFATSWAYQVRELLRRQHYVFWRDPMYLVSKLALNIVGGLLMGFTFWKAKDSIQGAQNKLFVIFMGTVLSVPLGAQLHVPYIDMRNIYEIRERSSRMYHWSALTLSQVALELPWNILGSSLFFVCFYWTVGLQTDRAGFTYFIYGVSFPIYYTTIALAIGALSPSAEIAGLLWSLGFSFVLTFNGILQPFSQLGWWQWMYHLSPYTYLVEALIGQGFGHEEITCAAKELVTIQPPSGEVCSSYMGPYISSFGGYLTNPDATSACQFCSARTTDQWLGPTFNMFYSHHWRDFGLFWAYILFNFALLFFITYYVRIRTHKVFPFLAKKIGSIFSRSN